MPDNDFEFRRGYHFGIAEEQERIIKLLDDLAFIDEMGDVMIGEFKSDVIALIKGENK